MINSQRIAEPIKSRSDRILDRCFFTGPKTLSGQPLSQSFRHRNSQQIRTQTSQQFRTQNSQPTSILKNGSQKPGIFRPLNSKGQTKPLINCSQSNPLPKPVAISPNRTEPSQSQTDSNLRLFSNRELMNQILHSNRDKEMIEKVDKKLVAFQQTLSEVREELEGKQIEKIFTECVRKEFSTRFFKLNESLTRAQEENTLLKEEVARLRMNQRTVKDMTNQQNQWLNDFKQEVINSLAEVQANDSIFDCDNDSFRRLSRTVDRIESLLQTNNTNDWSDSDDNESIDWFDSI